MNASASPKAARLCMKACEGCPRSCSYERMRWRMASILAGKSSGRVLAGAGVVLRNRAKASSTAVARSSRCARHAPDMFAMASSVPTELACSALRKAPAVPMRSTPWSVSESARTHAYGSCAAIAAGQSHR
jgi:hypothetical protein